MSEEYWSDGVKKHTEEEQQAYDQKVGAVTGGNYEQPDNGYYSGEMGGEPQAPEPQAPIDNGRPGAEEALQGIMNNEPAPTTEPEPVQNHWLADRDHFAEVWANFEADPNYQDEHYTREQMNMLYDYYSSQNHGAPIEQWQSLPADDPFVTQEMEKNNWYDPVKEEQAAQANRDPMLDIYNPTDPCDNGNSRFYPWGTGSKRGSCSSGESVGPAGSQRGSRRSDILPGSERQRTSGRKQVSGTE